MRKKRKFALNALKKELENRYSDEIEKLRQGSAQVLKDLELVVSRPLDNPKLCRAQLGFMDVVKFVNHQMSNHSLDFFNSTIYNPSVTKATIDALGDLFRAA
ncbi:hypothetical protein ACH5RR_032224 [Cinchona calisaya]|uniref:Uncharacterized protein n=1 Tax=Cinchona calisaya TaxID=153742 RepID=A0ABD2YKJ9_9GENT